jgi:hypothetical protein
MPEVDLNTIGARGLVVYDGENYTFVREDEWRGRGPVSNPPAALTRLTELHAVVAKLEETIFVDLDGLGELERTQPEVPERLPPSPWREGSSIVLRESGNFYQITPEDLEELDEGFEGDAGVLVNRGAVVAAIPSNAIPSGTYCVLVNQASFIQ